MKRLILAAGAAVLIAATSSPAISPGVWAGRADITDLRMPGAPPMIARLMAKRPITWSSCVSAAEAAKGPPLGTYARAGCTVTGTRTGQGGFATRSVCPLPDGGTATTDIEGTYTADRFQATAVSVHAGKTPLTMTMKMSGTRKGGC